MLEQSEPGLFIVSLAWPVYSLAVPGAIQTDVLENQQSTGVPVGLGYSPLPRWGKVGMGAGCWATPLLIAPGSSWSKHPLTSPSHRPNSECGVPPGTVASDCLLLTAMPFTQLVFVTKDF